MPVSDDLSLGDLFGQLVEDGKRYAHAEIALYRAKLTDRIVPLRTAAALGAVAIMIVQAALVALLVGLVLWLAPVLGPMGSTLAVVAASLLLAGLLGYLAYRAVTGSETKAR